jgi:hypothetical protein
MAATYRYENEHQAAVQLARILQDVADGDLNPNTLAEYSAIRKYFITHEDYQRLKGIEYLERFVTPTSFANYHAMEYSGAPARKRPSKGDLALLLDRAVSNLIGFTSDRSRKASTPLVLESEDGFETSRVSVDPEAWTGLQSPAERVAKALILLPVVKQSLEDLLAQIEHPHHNGGPMDGPSAELVHNLRQLRDALATLIEDLEAGRVRDVLGEGLAAEIVLMTKRAAARFAHDPVSYSVSALWMCVLSACGFPGAAAWVSAMSLQLSLRRKD